MTTCRIELFCVGLDGIMVYGRLLINSKHIGLHCGCHGYLNPLNFTQGVEIFRVGLTIYVPNPNIGDTEW